MASILDGKIAAEALRLKILSECSDHSATLAIVQVGSDPRSASYVKNKLRTAEKWKIAVKHIDLPRSSSCKDISRAIDSLNKDSKVDGMIFQLPPDVENPISSEEIHQLLEMIDPKKDADGLLSANLGALVAMGENAGTPIPATPLGILRLLQHYKIPLQGVDVCILGKSRLVGMPLTILLEHTGATVTLCHSASKNTAAKAQNAKILIAATGVCGLVKKDFVHSGSVVVDVGIASTADGLRGDVAHEVYSIVEAYSPVPGGVGPMTVAALMENTIRLWKMRKKK